MSRQRPGQRRYIDPSSGAAAKKMHIFGWKNFLAVLLCLVLCAGGGALLIFYNTVNAVNYQPIEDQTDKDISSSSSSFSSNLEMDISSGQLLNDPMILNVMLFGEDNRVTGEEHGSSDTMTMVCIDNLHKTL